MNLPTALPWLLPVGFPLLLALALLRTGSSEVGYKKMLDIMSLQKDLGNDPLNYFVTAFGKVLEGQDVVNAIQQGDKMVTVTVTDEK